MSDTRPGRGRPPVDVLAPRGEQAVRASLVRAASELFAGRGPSRVSVREVARAAGVNHGLVHHYFGSKDALLRAVLDALASQAAAEVAGSPTNAIGFEPDGAVDRHARIVAHLLLESRDPTEVQTEFPAIDGLVRQLERRGVPEDEARRRAALIGATVLGWQLFEPFLVRAAGLEVDAMDGSDVLRVTVQRLLDSE